MQTRTYSEKKNARRAAKAAGVDPKLVVETEDGFTFPAPVEETEPETMNGHDQAGNGTDPEASAKAMKVAHSEAEAAAKLVKEMEDDFSRKLVEGACRLPAPLPGRRAVDDDPVDTAPPKVDEDRTDDIPAVLKVTPEDRKAAWERNPPKAAPIKPETATMATAKAKKGKGAKSGAKGLKTSSADKTATMLAMLKKGATVDALCKATAWLPHTLRARISGVAKPKSKGGEGIKIERERVDGVTSYRIAA